MAEQWNELGRENGPYIISEAVYQFMRLFICEQIQEVARPLVEEVATRFLQWGTKPQFDADEDTDESIGSPFGDGDADAAHSANATSGGGGDGGGGGSGCGGGIGAER